MAAKMFSLASCGKSVNCNFIHLIDQNVWVSSLSVMLFYDIVLTFGDEVEKIWKQRFTGATVLWCLVSQRLNLPELAFH